MAAGWKAAGAALVGAVAGALPAMAAYDGDGYYGPHGMWGGGGWMGWFMAPFTMILFLAIVVAVVVLIVRWLGGGHVVGMGPTHRRPALQILEERFARGEIDKEEFEDRRRTLGA